MAAPDSSHHRGRATAADALDAATRGKDLALRLGGGGLAGLVVLGAGDLTSYIFTDGGRRAAPADEPPLGHAAALQPRRQAHRLRLAPRRLAAGVAIELGGGEPRKLTSLATGVGGFRGWTTSTCS